MPALLGPQHTAALPAWFPDSARDAAQVVVLLVDGLGWEQLRERSHLAPTLAAMDGGPITTVVPSTTSTALTSAVTGLTPAEHGIIGYRIDLGGDVMNVLRWSTVNGDARKRHVPRDVQPFRAFLGQPVPVVSKIELENSGFSAAHLVGGLMNGWRTMSNISVEIAVQLAQGHRVVYAYYDGIDKVAHERGFGPYYDAELRMVDRMVGDVLDALPAGAVLLVTADHGQVDVGPRVAPAGARSAGRDPLPIGRRPLPMAPREARRRRRPPEGGDGCAQRRRLGRQQGTDPRSRVVRAVDGRSRGLPARRRRARRPRSDQLRRPRRFGAVPARLPARLADVGRDARTVDRRTPLTGGRTGDVDDR